MARPQVAEAPAPTKRRERREILAHAKHSMAIQKQARVRAEKGEVAADEETSITAGIEEALLKAGVPEAELRAGVQRRSRQAPKAHFKGMRSLTDKPPVDNDPGSTSGHRQR